MAQSTRHRGGGDGEVLCFIGTGRVGEQVCIKCTCMCNAPAGGVGFELSSLVLCTVHCIHTGVGVPSYPPSCSSPPFPQTSNRREW
jgi:hypothetical protein